MPLQRSTDFFSEDLHGLEELYTFLNPPPKKNFGSGEKQSDFR